jgi:hypothetical protein
MPKAQDIYAELIRAMPMSERLRLAAIILEDINQSAGSLLDYCDSWSEEDIRDVAAFSSQHAAGTSGDDRLV